MNLTSLTLTQLLPKHRFARSVSIMAGGTALAQFAGILAAPVLTRIYAPDDFGILAAFVALLAIVSVFSTLRYDLAIPLPKSDQEAAPALGLCFIAVTIFSLLAAVVTYSSGEEVGGLIRLPQLSHYLWLLPIAIAFGGIYESLLYWAIRSHAFPLIARTKIYQVLTLLIVQLSTFPLGSLGLLLGLVAGQAMAAVCLALPLMRQRWLLFRQIRVADLFRTARRYRRFPLFSTWASGFSILSTHIPPLMLAALFSPAAAGLYAVSHRILAMPMGMVGQAVGDAFRAEAAEARREARLPSLVINIYEKLVQIAMPPALLLILTGPELFALVFGSEWRMAGEFSQWMAPWLLLHFVVSPLSLLFDVLEKQLQELMFQSILLASRLAALFLGYWVKDVTWTVALFAMASTLCYLGKLVWLFMLTIGDWRPLCRPLLRSLGWAGALSSPIVIAEGFNTTTALWLVGMGLALALIGARYLLLLREAW